VGIVYRLAAVAMLAAKEARLARGKIQVVHVQNIHMDRFARKIIGACRPDALNKTLRRQ
jgi:hypothetical protein